MIFSKPVSFLPQLLLLLLLSPLASQAQSSNELVPPTWQMLDYLATDYAGAVQDGEVISTAEYAEMREFSVTIKNHLTELPDNAAKAELLQQATQLVAQVEQKATTEQVAKQAHQLADQLLKAYPIPTAPTHAPNLERGAALYQAHCAVCHGTTGAGDGTAAAALDPPPIAFTDVARADQRSPLSLYQTITQGVAGTSMLAFGKQLSEADRWALAYYAGSLAYTQDAAAGAKLWQQQASARTQISDLDELSRTRADQLSSVLGTDGAHQLVGYLRAHPEALEQAATGIALARGRLAASVSAYQKGDSKTAIRLALSAYLDGVEPVEPLLNAGDSALRARIELAMGAYRTSLAQGAPKDAIITQSQHIDQLLAAAEPLTDAASHTALATFVGAFTILLREGLEALLVVIAVFAFLNRAGRREALPYVHGGWLSALLAGGLTWLVARYFIDISGANRELTEGFSALFAAAVLLSVGLWMHQKSIGGRWQAYLQERLSHALSKKSAWFLFILIFVSVYREVFETILFYVALWSDAQGHWMLAGMVCGALVLAAIAWIMLRTSRKLPLATFFSVSSALIAILAFVMTGKGVAALQEAGWVNVSLAPLPHIDWLGVFPTWQTGLAQALVLVILIAGYFYNRRVSKS